MFYKILTNLCSILDSRIYVRKLSTRCILLELAESPCSVASCSSLGCRNGPSSRDVATNHKLLNPTAAKFKLPTIGINGCSFCFTLLYMVLNFIVAFYSYIELTCFLLFISSFKALVVYLRFLFIWNNEKIWNFHQILKFIFLVNSRLDRGLSTIPD